MTDAPRLSCLIPLYASQPFLDVICDNIDAHLAADAEILVSDRHCRDDTAHRLARRYANEPRVRVQATQDAADWVDNIDGLIAAARGTFFRIIPHDDSTSLAATLALVEALEADAQAILAYGVVRAIDLQGAALPGRDQWNVDERPGATAWTLDDALSLFWRGRFMGAFKGVVRAAPVRAHGVRIRKTPTLRCSERTWLFGLALLGRFHFVPDAVLVKRYHAGSASSGWIYTPQTFADAAAVMMAYCDDLIADPVQRATAKRSLALHAASVSPDPAARSARLPPYRSLRELAGAG